MKKLFFLFAIVAVLLSSCSPEKKAEKLIQKERATFLEIPESYEPIAMQLDSTFAPLETQDFISRLEEMEALQIKLQEGEEQHKKWMDQLHSCEWVLDNYSDRPHMQNRVEQKKLEAENCRAQLEKLDLSLEEIRGVLESKRILALKMMQEERFFNGYRVTHSYREVHRDGSQTVGYRVFMMDPDLKVVKYQTTKEEYDRSIQRLNRVIHFMKQD